MQIKAIAAVATNGVIGDHGDIPWELPADWQRFRRLTTKHTLVMGRTTFEAIGRPLPRRTTIVLTRDADWTPPASDVDDDTQVLVAHTIEEAIDLARSTHPDRTCWIAGGGDVYRAAMPYVTGLDISEVPGEPEGDTRFPDLPADKWRVLFREPMPGFTVAHYAPVAHTTRLLLEPVSVDDAGVWAELHGDRSLYQHRPDSIYQDKAEVDQILSAQITSWVETGVGYWIARDPATRRPVGLGGIRRRTEGDRTFWNLYYRLPEAEQGHGYAAEISRAAFAQLARLDPMAEVRAVIRPGHHESEGVARRLGMFEFGDLVDDAGRPGIIYTGILPQLLQHA